MERRPTERPARLHAVGWPELLTAAALLALLAAIAYLPETTESGFTFDDWSNAANSLQAGGFIDGVERYADITMYRPGLVVYVPALFQVLGDHMGWHLAWAAAIGVAVSAFLFGIVRTLGLPRPHAFLLAALVLIFPWFDSTRMWSTASQVTLGIAIAFAGFYVALVALRRRSWPLHLVALLLYVVSILTYEIALVLIAGAGIVYVAAVGWRAARLRWAADLAVVAGGALWVVSQSPRTHGGLSDHLEHLKDIVIAGGTMLGRSGLPLGPQQTTLVLLLLAAIAIAGGAVWWRDRSRDPDDRSPMLPWLLLGVAGIAVAAAGWVMFVPADPYYTPTTFGVTNRVNGLAGVGLVMIVYAACGVVGVLAGLLGPRGSARIATIVTVSLAVGVGVMYKAVIERHSDIWITAFRAQEAGLDQIRAQLPVPATGTTIFVAGYPANQTLGVPIFSSSWDLDGAVKLEYGSPDISAYPVLLDTRIVCGRDGVRLVGGTYAGAAVPFGRAALLNLATGLTSVPRNVRACRRSAPEMVPGPLYLSFAY